MLPMQGTADTSRDYTIDPLIEPLVISLNRLAGVRTTSSCQGHDDDRRPHVAFYCDEDTLRLILAAITVLNLAELRQVRAYVEILDYDGATLHVVLRFHHLFLQVKPEPATVREWHRRIRVMNTLVRAELESGLLRTMEVRPAFGEITL